QEGRGAGGGRGRGRGGRGGRGGGAASMKSTGNESEGRSLSGPILLRVHASIGWSREG
ncbi:unnamed protein product, partial [Closterium sp. NIES-53]